MEFRRQVPVRLSQPPWNNDEALRKNISVFQYRFIVIIITIIITLNILSLVSILQELRLTRIQARIPTAGNSIWNKLFGVPGNGSLMATNVAF